MSNVILISPYVARAYGDLLVGKRTWDIPNPVADEFFEVRRPVEPGLLLFAGRLIPRTLPRLPPRARTAR